MESIQTIVLGHLENLIEDGGLTPAHNRAYGNTGNVQALTEDLDVVTTIVYDFQTTYFTLRVHRGNIVASGRSTQPEFVVSTINGKSNSEALMEVADYLAK